MRNDMGQSQAISMAVVGVTISLVLWSGFARVAQSNEKVARSNERLAASKERLAAIAAIVASNERLAASNERVVASNEVLAAAMNAQRAYAPAPDSNQKDVAASGVTCPVPPSPRPIAPQAVRTSTPVTITEGETGPKRSRNATETR